MRASGESDPGCSPHRGDDGEGRVREELGKQFIAERSGAASAACWPPRSSACPEMIERAEIVNASPELLEAMKNPAAISYLTRRKLPSTGPARPPHCRGRAGRAGQPTIGGRVSDHPPGYTQEEWDSYLQDPCGWCIRELGSAARNVRENAADILRGLGRDAEPALPFLIAHFQDPDRGVRLACLHAVGEHGGATGAGGEACARALKGLLDVPDPEARSLAVFGLGRCGLAAAKGVPRLQERLIDTDAEVRSAAETALTRIARAATRSGTRRA